MRSSLVAQALPGHRCVPMGACGAACSLFPLLPLLGAVSGCGGRTGLWVPLGDDAVDAALPPLDVAPSGEPTACADAGAPTIYLVTAPGNLIAYDPLVPAAFPRIGHLECPATGDCHGTAPSPFSMAVDRLGTAFVVYCDGEIFRVSTVTAQCEATGFRVPSSFSTGFGMAFAQDESDSNETLYVASGANPLAIPPTLASIRTSDGALHVIAPFNPAIMDAELTGTGSGALFAFYMADNGASSAIGQIDKTTARRTGELRLPGLAMTNAWAFVFWGGSFYTFTAPGSSTIVTKVRPSDGMTTTLAELGEYVVGAGVSTCAPQQ